MRIFDAEWTPTINLLRIACVCNKIFDVRADRWIVRCPYCGFRKHLGQLRDEYVERKRSND